MTKLCNDFLGQAVKINIFLFATYTFPKTHLVCPPKFCILSIVFNFSWEIKNKGYAKFWGANKMYYRKCANGKLLVTNLIIKSPQNQVTRQSFTLILL